MPTEAEDRAAIQAVLDRVFSTYIAKDLDGMVDCYSADVVTMMPFGMPTYGRDEWRNLLADAFSRQDVLDIVSDTEEILLFGDWAWVWLMEWAKRRRIENGEEYANFIRTGLMFRREPNGEWKIARYIANVVNIEEDFDEHVARFRANSKRGALNAIRTQR